MEIWRFVRAVVNASKFYAKHMTRPASSILFIVAPFVGVKYANYELVATMISVALILRFTAYLLNVHNNIPVPEKRFTEDTPDGVRVNKDEREDMILYMCDLENYLEREGLM